MLKTLRQKAVFKSRGKGFFQNLKVSLCCRKKKGFTLIELLVVVTIIGIITVVSTAVFTEARARSRDSRRVSDVKVLHDAMAMYTDAHQLYPVVTVAPPGIAINGSDAVSQALINEGILKTGVADPKTGQEINGEVFNYYYYSDAEGKTYTITYCLETDSVAGQSQGCGNSATY